MPPKKKRKPRPTQSQKQSQRVTVNIGSTKSAPRKKKSGGGGGIQRYAHNLAPTFITAPQADYTPLLAMMQHLAPKEPMHQQVTPLSSISQATNAIANEQRIAQPVEEHKPKFQPLPSQARERAEEDRVAVTPSVKPPDAPSNPYILERPPPSIPTEARRARLDEPNKRKARMELSYMVQQAGLIRDRDRNKTGLQQAEEAISIVEEAMKPPPSATAKVKRGRPFKNTTVAVPFDDTRQAGVLQQKNDLHAESLGAAEEVVPKKAETPKQAEAKAKKREKEANKQAKEAMKQATKREKEANKPAPKTARKKRTNAEIARDNATAVV